MSSGWQTGDRNTAPRSDWEAKRLGFDAPASLIQAANLATREILSACGVSPALFEASAAAAVREAWRQLLFGTIAPLGRLVAHELSRKLEAEVSLDWHELRASDLAGRARAFQSMVGGGMDPAKAAALGRAHGRRWLRRTPSTPESGKMRPKRGKRSCSRWRSANWSSGPKKSSSMLGFVGTTRRRRNGENTVGSNVGISSSHARIKSIKSAS